MWCHPVVALCHLVMGLCEGKGDLEPPDTGAELLSGTLHSGIAGTPSVPRARGLQPYEPPP